MDYNFKEIEKFWQKYWAKNQTFKTSNNSDKPKYYVLDMFPYPSGAGLHVGHPLGYIASDIVSRYKRHTGHNVLHPMGYDSFGLPAEQYAIQTGQHPAITTETNINRYREQLDKLGFSYDWDREVRTSDPAYYKWTQWIFIQLFNSWYDNNTEKARPITELIQIFETEGNTNVNAATSQTELFTAEQWNHFTEKEKSDILLNYRLTYLAEAEVNWCPALGTVLANDEVINGVSERGGHPVIRKKMTQWMMRITAYAERLLQDLEKIDWPQPIKDAQTNWIGKSKGAMVYFPLSPKGGKQGGVGIFTTRPDTIFGVTYMTLAPEHPLVSQITTPEQKTEVEKYIEETAKRSERERMADTKTVSGVFTGAYATHPFTKEPVPIWIGDYVLSGYGTGAVMAVPAGDERDFAFAKHFQGKNGMPEIKNIFNLTPNPSPHEQQRTDEVKERGTEVVNNQGDIHGATSPSPLERGLGGEVNNTLPLGEGWGGVAFTSKDNNFTYINSDFLNGLNYTQAIDKIIAKLESSGAGEGKINYRLRDAVFSRQRYWGEPVPIYFENGIPKAIPVENLPLELPEVEKYLPTETGEPPLGRAKQWHWDTNTNKVVSVPDGEKPPLGVWGIELNTMPGWAGSSWYFNRYMDPKNTDAPFDKAVNDYWGQVDLYLGGSEHATGHLLYSRFWQKFLYDLGYVKHDEYAKKLMNQGMILGNSAFVWRVAFTTMDSNENEAIEKLEKLPTIFLSHDLIKNWDKENFIPKEKLIEIVGDRFHLDNILIKLIPTHVDISLINESDNTLNIEKFKAWRPEYRDAYFYPSPALPEGEGDRVVNIERDISDHKKSMDRDENYKSDDYSYFNDFGYMSADPQKAKYLIEFAKQMRAKPTLAEKLLWKELKGEKMGFQFRRQHYFGQFIVDFVCMKKRLVVEVDGDIHDYQKEYDEERTKFLEEIGFKVIRFSNEQILFHISSVLHEINNNLLSQNENSDIIHKNVTFQSPSPSDKQGQSIALDEGCERSSAGEGFHVSREVEKMSKSKYNVVNPDDICEQYGADTLRMYEMFLGPIEQAKPWNTQGISGVHNFLRKFYRLILSVNENSIHNDLPFTTPSPSDKRGQSTALDEGCERSSAGEGFKILHQTIKKITEDIENFSFNTSIAQFMIATNELTKLGTTSKEILEPLLILISPFAPHMAEELWQKLGHKESITYARWPKFDEKYLASDTKDYPVSFNGKRRFNMELPLGLSKEEVEKMVMADERTQKELGGRTPKNFILVEGKIINIVG